MFMIYWSVNMDGQKLANSKEFGRNAMLEALQFTESLRLQQRQGASISHITMSCENPDSVGSAGVADVAPGYAWKKRR